MTDSPNNNNTSPDLSDENIANALSAGLETTGYSYKDENINQVINSYRIIMKIGEGGMGKVYLAKHELIGKLACIKICKKQPGSSFDERFLREAKILAKLDHSNLITAFDFGSFEGGHYILMPYIKAISLAEMLEQKKSIPIEESVAMVIQAAKGLHAAHQEQIIHRDVKPGNLLVDADGKVWVSDFGISLMSGGNHSYATQTGETLGSPSYISPEQIEGNSVDYKADIYALGATLYHLICNTPPYLADNPLIVLRKHLEEELTPDPKLLQCPPALIACIKKMLAKKPSDRQDNMLKVAEELEKAMQFPENNIQATTVRLSEDTLQQIIQRSHEIQAREDTEVEGLSKNDLYDIGRDLEIPNNTLEQARKEIELEKKLEMPKPKVSKVSNTDIELVKKLRFIELISVIGIFIPFINFFLCEYICLFLFKKLARTPEFKKYDTVIQIGKLSHANLIIAVFAIPSGFFKGEWDRDFVIIEGIHSLLVLAFAIISLIIMWKVFTTAIIILGEEHKELSGKLKSSRLSYLIISLVSGFVIEITILAIAGGTVPIFTSLILGLIILPIGWVLGYLFLLRPLRETEEALEKAIQN